MSIKILNKQWDYCKNVDPIILFTEPSRSIKLEDCIFIWTIVQVSPATARFAPCLVSFSVSHLLSIPGVTGVTKRIANIRTDQIPSACCLYTSGIFLFLWINEWKEEGISVEWSSSFAWFTENYIFSLQMAQSLYTGNCAISSFVVFNKEK